MNRTLKKLARTSLTTFLVFVLFVSNTPIGLFDFALAKWQDRNVVDLMWHAQNSRSVVDSFRPNTAYAAVAYDATSESHTGTSGSASQSSFSWTHTPAGTPRGILVFVFTNANSDTISTVTYGGVTMTEVSGGQAADTTGEPGRTTTFFLGSSIPTGAQTVTVNRTNNSTVMYAVAASVTAAANTETTGFVLLQNNGTLAVQSVNDGSPGTNSQRFAAINSGLGAVPAAGTGSTVMHGLDIGARVVQTVRETTPGQGARNVGFSSGSSDDRAAVHLAVREVANPPTVTTDAATNVVATSTTLNGEITDIGGANATARGFAWGTESDLSDGDTATTTESGSFGAATFDADISELTGNTTYYARAYATNSGGTSYGSIQSVLTVPDIPGGSGGGGGGGGAVPTLEQYGGEGFVSATYAPGTSFDVAMPSSVEPGDLLGVFFGAAVSLNTPAGWTRVPDAVGGSAEARLGIYFKLADGSEDGTNVTFTSSGSTAGQTFRIHVLEANWSGDLGEIYGGTYATGAGTTPNPPSVGPVDAADYLAIAIEVSQFDTVTNVYPSNYTGNQRAVSHPSFFSHMAAATRELSAATSEDPGAFTNADAEDWVAQTILIAPAAGGGGTSVQFDNSDVAYVFDNTTLTLPSFAVASNDNRALVAIVANALDGSDTPTSVVFNGDEAFTNIVNGTTGSTVESKTSLWILENPTVTTADIVATYSSSNRNSSIFVTSLYNVDLEDPLVNATKTDGEGSPYAVSVAGVTDGMTIAYIGSDEVSGAFTYTGSGTERENQLFNTDEMSVSGVTYADSGTHDSTWTIGGVSTWAALGVTVNPAAATGGEVVYNPPTFSSVTANSMRVEWTAPVGSSTSYKLERCSGEACTDFSQIASGVVALFYDDSGLSTDTLYRYRVRGTNATGDGLYSAVGEQTTLAAADPPTVETDAATNVVATSTTLNGEITATGDENATVRGFAWGTNASLSNGDTATTSEEGDFGAATFSTDISSLIGNTTYYYRAYATNGGGTSYGSIQPILTVPNIPGGSGGGGAAPTLEQYSDEGFFAASYAADTSFDVAMPATVESGDLLGIFFGIDSNVNINTPSGFTRIPDAIGGTDVRLVGFFKIADGSEDGTNVNVTIESTSGAISFRTHILAANWSGDLEDIYGGTYSAGSSANPDPPSVGPVEAADYLSIAIAFSDFDTTTNAFPTNYADNQLALSHPGFFSHMTAATRELSAATTEDPGTFTNADSEPWVSQTILIAPAAGAVAPTFSSVTANSMRVEWTAPVGSSTSYKLERCSGEACTDFSQIASGVVALFYDDSGLSTDTLYRYRVRGTNATGDGLYSAVGEQTTDVAPPTVSVSGTLYSDEGSSAITTAGISIKLVVGTTTPGVFSTTTCSGCGGFFEFNGSSLITSQFGAGVPFHVFVDNNAIRASTVTKASSTSAGANITGLDLYQNRLIVRHEATSATSTTNADLALLDTVNLVQEGSDFTVATNNPALTGLTSNRVAYLDADNDDLRTYEFDGTTWAQVGNDFNMSNGDAALAALSPNRIAAFDINTDNLRTYEFDGTDWSQVGNNLNISDSSNAALAALSSTRVAFFDAANENLNTYEFDGTDWVQVGNGLNISGAGIPALSPLSANRVAYIDSNLDSLRTYEFDGTDWTLVGSGFSVGSTDTPALAALTPSRVAFIDANNDDLRVYEFSGTAWVQAGNELTDLGNAFPALAALSPNRIAFLDDANTDLRTYEVSDPGRLFAASVNELAVASSTELHIWTGDTFEPGGEVKVTQNGGSGTDGSVHIDDSATFTAGGAVTVGGSWAADAGSVFDPHSDDGLIFNAAVSGKTLAGNLIDDGALGDVFFNGSGGVWTFSNNASTTDFTITNGTVTAPPVLSVSGDYSNSGSFTDSSGTVLFDGTTQAISGTLNTAATDFASVQFAGSGTKTFSNNASTTDFTIRSGATVAAPSLLTISGDYSNAGTFDDNSGTIYFEGSTDWEQIGNDLNIASISNPALAALSSTRLAYVDSGLDNLRTYDFDGTNWAQTGNGLAIGSLSLPTLTALTSDRVAFIDAGQEDLRLMEFDGTDWSLVGSHLDISGVGSNGLARLADNSVAFIDSNLEELRTYEHDGSTWSQVGNSFGISGVGLLTLTALSSTRVAFIDSDLGSLRTYEFDGTDWSLVGNALAVSINEPALTTLSSNRIVLAGSNIEGFRVYEFDGTDWSLIGDTFSTPDIGVPAVAALTSSRITFIDSALENLQTYSNAKTLSGTMTGSSALNNAIFAGGWLFSDNAAANNFSTLSGATLTAPAELSIFGNYSNAGTFDANSGTVYIASTTAPQTFSGTMSGTSAFNNLTFLTGSASATTTFSASLTVAGTFTATTPDTRIEFPSGATTTVGDLTVTGGEEQEVYLHGSSNEWNLEVLGTHSVEYANIKDSHACGASGNLTAANSTDSGGNTCWIFGAQVVGTLALSEHTDGQASNVFTTVGSFVDNHFFGFALTPADEDISVTSLAVAVSQVRGIAQEDITNAQLFIDYDDNGAVDGGDEQVGGAGAVSVSGAEGTVTFSTPFSATTTRSYLLQADIASVAGSDRVRFTLPSSNIAATGATSQQSIAVSGAVSAALHYRLAAAGGGGGGGGEADAPAPQGQGIQEGGDEGGGEDTGGGAPPGDEPGTGGGGGGGAEVRVPLPRTLASCKGDLFCAVSTYFLGFKAYNR